MVKCESNVEQREVECFLEKELFTGKEIFKSLVYPQGFLLREVFSMENL